MSEFGIAITRSQGAGVSYFVGSALLSCYFACSQVIAKANAGDLAEFYISDDDIAAVARTLAMCTWHYRFQRQSCCFLVDLQQILLTMH